MQYILQDFQSSIINLTQTKSPFLSTRPLHQGVTPWNDSSLNYTMECLWHTLS